MNLNDIVNPLIYYIYPGFIILGFIRGSISGLDVSLKWKSRRKMVSIGSSLYDPIINMSRDVGYIAHQMLLGGIGSAIITATAPISVPILLKWKSKDVENTKPEEKKNLK